MCTILEEEGDSFDIDNVPTKNDNINTKSRRYKGADISQELSCNSSKST
jgi:hypothetical protein